MASHLKIVFLSYLILLLVVLGQVNPVSAKKNGIKKKLQLLDKTIKELKEEIKEQDVRLKGQEERIKTLEDCEACSKIQELNKTLNELEEKIPEPDIDECATNTDNCDVNAVCTNTPGSYICKCKDGFSGDGQSCTDLDECSTHNHTCDVNADCVNSAGSYLCNCKAGYTGDGENCTVNVVRWLEYTPEWCGHGNRRQIKWGDITEEQCKQRCLHCTAIEYWSGPVKICFECLDPTKRQPYTVTADRAYPPHVFVRQ